MAAAGEVVTSSAITTNTTTSLRDLPPGAHKIMVYGTWDGATADIQIGFSSTFATVGSDGQFTADGVVLVQGPCAVQVVTTNVGTTSLNVAYF